jgi:mRNA interferase MazF
MSTNLIDNAEPLRIRVKKRDRLEKDSDAMIEQLRSVSKRQIGEKIATLSQEEMSKIEYGIKEMLGLF